MRVVPSAASPASTKAALARKSEAITGAPFRAETPRIVATRPLTCISAPMRTSSGTCIKRFSKILSSITEFPLESVINAIS